MARWLRLLTLASVLSVGEGCGLKPPAVPHLEVRGEAIAAAAAEAGVVPETDGGFAARPALGPGILRPVRSSRG